MHRRCIVTLGALALLGWLGSQTAFAAITVVTRTLDTGQNPPAIAPNPMAEDELSFTDRTHEWNEVPGFLLGGQYVQIANNDRDKDMGGLDITIDADHTLALMIDNRVNVNGNMPWVAADGWVDTYWDIGVDEGGDGDIDQRSSVYVKDFTAGLHTFGNQNQGGTNMYGVCIVTGAIGAPGLAPNGYIQTRGWNMLFLGSLLGCEGLRPSTMLENWVAPYDLQAEEPRAGDTWPDIDFGGGSPAHAASWWHMSADPLWITTGWVESTYGLFGMTNGDSVDCQAIRNFINSNIQGMENYGAGDHAVNIATTYVNNVSGGPLAIQICEGSDDSIQLWLNNKLLSNVRACRGSGGCQERINTVLPEGVSRLTVLNFEQGGGFNFRVQLNDASGTALTDGNGLVEYLGAGAVGDGLAAQVEPTAVRSTTQIEDCPTPAGESVAIAVDPAAAAAVTVEETVASLVADGAIADVPVISNVAPAATRIDVLDGGSGAVGPDFAEHRYVGYHPACGPLSGASYDGGTGVYSLTHHGNRDIWNDGDTFEFAFNKMEGDVDIAIKIVYPFDHIAGGSNNGWNKGGIMVREALVACSPHYFMCEVDPDNSGRCVQGRVIDTDGNLCNQSFNDSGNAGGLNRHVNYLRVTRTAGNLQAWASNGDDADANTIPDVEEDSLAAANWIKMNREELNLVPDQAYFGVAMGVHGGACDAYTLNFEVLHLVGTKVAEALPAPPAMSQTIVWENVPAAAAAADGLAYDVAAAAAGSVGLSGELVGAGAIPGPDAIAVNPAVAPIGQFENSMDLGGVRAAGYASFDAATGEYVVAGSGNDFWAGGDQGHIAYMRVVGDFQATCRITAINETVDDGTGNLITQPFESNDGWARHGLMCRFSCDTNSRYSFACNVYRGNIIRDEDATNDVDNMPRRHQYARGNNGGWFRAGDCSEQVIPKDIGGDLDGDGKDDNIAGIHPRFGWTRVVKRGKYFYSMWAPEAEVGEGEPPEPGRWVLVGGNPQINPPDTTLLAFASQSHNSGPGQGYVPMEVHFDNLSVELLDPVILTQFDVGAAIPINFDAEAEGTPPAGAVVYDGGSADFAPIVVKDTPGDPASNGKLRLCQDGVGGDGNAVFYNIPAAQGLAEGGFQLEMDVFASKAINPDDPDADLNPADGMVIAVLEGNLTGAEGDVVGETGGGMGWRRCGRDSIPPCRRPGFGVEFDIWDGGGGRGNDPLWGGANRGPDDWYNIGIDFHQSDHSAVNNVLLGVGTNELPDWFQNPAGVHVRMEYRPFAEGQAEVNVYVKDNANGGGADGPLAGELLAVSAIGPVLQGDIAIGATAGTGGAHANFEVDNVLVQKLCVETPDAVDADGDSEATPTVSTALLAATFTGADGDVSYSWSSDDVTIATVAPDPADGSKAEVTCLREGDVNITVEADDDTCGNTVSDVHDVHCNAPPGIERRPMNYNLDAQVDMSDGISLLTKLFLNAKKETPCDPTGEETFPTPADAIILNWNGDAVVDMTDAIALFARLFLGGPPHHLGEDCILVSDCGSEEEDRSCGAAAP